MPSEEEDDNDVEEEEDDIIDEEEKEEEEAEEMLTPVKAKFSKKRLLKIAIRFIKHFFTQPTLRGTTNAIFALCPVALAPEQ